MEEIIVLSADSGLNERLAAGLKGYNLQIFTGSNGIIDRVYNSPPSLLVVNAEDEHLKRFIPLLRDDPIFSHLPIMAVFRDHEVITDWGALPADDFIMDGFDGRELRMRVSLCIHRSRRMVETNPLTKLPGNIPVIKEVQKRLDLGEEFALAYADLDNFKPYNDKYGFSRGDEIIRMTGRLITNITKLRNPDGCFVGHIGGDDFVFITSPEKAEPVCREITESFEQIVPTFYDPEDRERGCILSRDREGKERCFPLLSISIGVTFNRGWFKHYGAMSAAASELKKYAKTFAGNVYRLDRRHHG